jgi:hypothetical protein
MLWSRAWVKAAMQSLDANPRPRLLAGTKVWRASITCLPLLTGSAKAEETAGGGGFNLYSKYACPSCEANRWRPESHTIVTTLSLPTPPPSIPAISPLSLSLSLALPRSLPLSPTSLLLDFPVSPLTLNHFRTGGFRERTGKEPGILLAGGSFWLFHFLRTVVNNKNKNQEPPNIVLNPKLSPLGYHKKKVNNNNNNNNKFKNRPTLC